MPIQDNENKRTAENSAVSAEEELRKKQMQKQENNVQKSGKLLPFLNAKANHHRTRLENLNEKIATQHDKIAKHTTKIEKLSMKAEKLEDTNRMLKSTLGNFPFAKNLIQKNEKRIANIRENKIPNRQQKLQNCHSKLEKFSAKNEQISHKLNRVIALNDTIKSFSLGLNKERREAFSDAISRLNTATVDCLNDRKNAMISQKNQLMQTYNSPDTSMVDKFKLQKKIDETRDKIASLENKIEKLKRPENHYKNQSDVQLDASIKITSDRIGEAVENGNISMPEISVQAVESAQEVENLSSEKTAEIAGQLRNVEEQIEDDYNMIDGLINNGSKEEIDKTRAELRESIKSLENIAENPLVSKEIRDSATEELAKMQKQLEILDMADDVAIDNWLSDMLDSGNAVITDDGYKINPDYYREIPRDERHFETMTEIQAVQVMSELTAKNVPFSAVTRGEDKVSLTVSKNDVQALNDVMRSAIGKTARTNSRENSEKLQKIKPEYYNSLPKEKRFTCVEPKDTARKIVAGLQQQNIPYSAVVRQNDTVSVTVSRDDLQAYRQIESAVKGERSQEFVRPENGKVQPKRVTEKNGRRAFFSRSNMQRDAQRISGRGQKNLQQQEQTPKKKNQGLE